MLLDLSNSKLRDIAAERLLRCRPTLSSSLMVSAAVSKLGCTELFFVEPGVKVNGRYWDDECRRCSKPKQCRFRDTVYSMTVKRHNFRGSCFPGSAETLVRRGGITNHHLIAYSSNIFSLCMLLYCCYHSWWIKLIIPSQQHLWQKLRKSVDVRWNYSEQHQCRFWDTL